MSAVQVAITGWFAVHLSVQLLCLANFAAMFRQPRRSRLPDSELPTVLVVLAIRGGDEFLSDTLHRLSSLDYPNYTLRIVLDSKTDPAVRIVNQYIESCNNEHVEILHLESRPSTCSGKIAGLLEATKSLPEDCEIVAIVDGDAVLEATCLRLLVEPLLRGAALASGNRWYAPSASNFTGMIRYIWNGFAVNAMSVVKIPWGGCMALHASSIADPRLRSRLSQAFGEDSTVATFMIQQDSRIEFVPDCIVVNADTCSFKGLYNFLVRQYLTVRLHNPVWKPVFFGTLVLGVSTLAGYASLLIPGLHRIPIVGGIFGVTATACLQLAVSGFLIRRRKTMAGISYQRFSIKHGLVLLPAMFCCAALNVIAACHAALAKRHTWRGITYGFNGRSLVEIVNVVDSTESFESTATASQELTATSI